MLRDLLPVYKKIPSRSARGFSFNIHFLIKRMCIVYPQNLIIWRNNTSQIGSSFNLMDPTKYNLFICTANHI